MTETIAPYQAGAGGGSGGGARPFRDQAKPTGYWRLIVPTISAAALEGDPEALRRDIEESAGNWRLKAEYEREAKPGLPRKWKLTVTKTQRLHSRHHREALPVQWDLTLRGGIVADGETLAEAALALDHSLKALARFARDPAHQAEFPDGDERQMVAAVVAAGVADAAQAVETKE